MKKANGALVGAFLLSVSASLFAQGAGDLRLVIRVFMIPQGQQFDSTISDGRGGTVALQVYGNITSAFPKGTVFFPTDLAANASDDAISSAVRDKIVFGCGGLLASKVSLRELKSLDLVLGLERPKAESRFEEARGEGRTSNYRVEAELLSAEKGNALVRLRFDAGWSAVGGSIGVGISDDVISAPFEVPESKLLLVGGISSGTVYWLAVCTLPRD